MNKHFLFSLLLLLSFSTFADEEKVLVPDDYATLEEAIQAYEDKKFSQTVIELQPGVYSLDSSIFLPSGLSIVGKETATTIIEAADGVDNLALFVIDASDSIEIHRLTFKNAAHAIVFQNAGSSTSVTISNNIFFLGDENTAIAVTDVSFPTITNNTFYKNKYAIAGSDTGFVDVAVKYNIFSNNEFVSIDLDELNYVANCYYANTNELASIDSNSIAGSPAFVALDAVNNFYDFHLTSDSKCIDGGTINDESNNDALDDTANDYGAYGGTNADTFPYPVRISFSDPVGTDGVFAVTVSWTPDASYPFDDGKGYYKLYFDNQSNGEFNLKFSDDLYSGMTLEDDGSHKKSLNGFSVTPEETTIPKIQKIVASNQRLDIEWSAVENVTDYQVSYQAAGSSVQTKDVTDATKTALTGLNNGTEYTVSVSAIYQPVLYFYVAAVAEVTKGNSEVTYEGLWHADYEKKVSFGDATTGTPSDSKTAIPDKVIPYPNLPNEGCFIATATFGSYDAPQVQVFRDFRDSFLLRTQAGTRFVKFYYRYGPIAANWVRHNPWSKPIFQAALSPYLLLSLIYLKLGTLLGNLALFVMSVILPWVLWRSRKIVYKRVAGV